MTRFAVPVLANPSVIPSDIAGLGLPVFQTVADALAARDSDEAFAVLYPTTIARCASQFLEGFPGKPIFAVKANPHPAVISILWSAGLRAFDVASIRELDLVASICPDAELYFMHPVKSRQTIQHAYRAGVRHFAFDCAAELTKLREETGHAKDLHLHLRLALPDSRARMPLTGKFGAEVEDAISLLIDARRAATKLGVAFHVGSQCLDPESYVTAIGHVRNLANLAGVTIDTLDCGGGFPVDYPGQTAPDLRAFFAAISDGVSHFGFDHVDVLGEPGRALCATGGSTLARVDLRKGAQLYINDGTYGTLFDAGHPGWTFPVQRHRVRSVAEDAPLQPFSLFGPTCDSLDRMDGPFYLPDNIEEGDWIEFGHLGAYGQALRTAFNGFETRDTVAIVGEVFNAGPIAKNAGTCGQSRC